MEAPYESLTLIGPVVYEEKMFENVDTHKHIRTTEAYLSHKFTIEPLNMMAIYPKVHLVDSKMFAKFDEIPLMPLQNIEQKPNCHGWTEGEMDGISCALIRIMY